MQDSFLDENGNWEVRYRHIGLAEKNRGELYPLLSLDIYSFSDFGLGIGVYYFQLILYAILLFICGFILSPSMMVFKDYFIHGPSTNSTAIDALLSVSGTCLPAVAVNATQGCPMNESKCLAEFRYNDSSCDLHGTNIKFDLIMCVVFVVGILIIEQLEDWWVTDLDEAIQTAQDYALMVTDPPEDALNPDEWYEFFSRFGLVK